MHPRRADYWAARQHVEIEQSAGRDIGLRGSREVGRAVVEFIPHRVSNGVKEDRRT